jgi:hypothetical protein
VTVTSSNYPGYSSSYQEMSDPGYFYEMLQQNQVSPAQYQGPVEWFNCNKCSPGSTEVWDNTFGHALSDQSNYDGKFGADILRIWSHQFH